MSYAKKVKDGTARLPSPSPRHPFPYHQPHAGIHSGPVGHPPRRPGEPCYPSACDHPPPASPPIHPFVTSGGSIQGATLERQQPGVVFIWRVGGRYVCEALLPRCRGDPGHLGGALQTAVAGGRETAATYRPPADCSRPAASLALPRRGRLGESGIALQAPGACGALATSSSSGPCGPSGPVLQLLLRRTPGRAVQVSNPVLQVPSSWPPVTRLP